MDYILHLLGLCPDSMSHFDLFDLINLYLNYKNKQVVKKPITLLFLLGILSCKKDQVKFLKNDPPQYFEEYCKGKRFYGNFYRLNKNVYLLDTIHFFIQKDSLYLEFPQLTKYNDTPIFYRDVTNCDSIWDFTNSDFPNLTLKHHVFFIKDTLVDSIYVNDTFNQCNLYKKF